MYRSYCEHGVYAVEKNPFLYDLTVLCSSLSDSWSGKNALAKINTMQNISKAFPFMFIKQMFYLFLFG